MNCNVYFCVGFLVLLFLSGCGGAGSSSLEMASDPVSDAGSTGSGSSNQSTDSSSDGVSTADIFCDYSDTTENDQASLTLTSQAEWFCSPTARQLSANGIPDHPVGQFPNPGNPNTITEQNVSEVFTLTPSQGESVQAVGGPRGPAGYVLNGVKIDADTAGSCDISGNCSLTSPNGAWNIEALGQGAFDFGEDENNAHVQPGGVYHYHGIPEGFLTKRGAGPDQMTLIGWASDGFPIYARYGYSDASDAGSNLEPMTGSYQLVDPVPSDRPSVETYALGTFKQDWEYVEGSGDLDECNGRFGVTPEFPDGIYHYYATDSYPYFQRCLSGDL
jgi:hypothetical protein